MITYDYTEAGRRIRHMYFIDNLTYDDFKAQMGFCDELSVYYAKNLDERINLKYGKILIYMSRGSEWRSKNYSIMIDLKKSEKEILENFHKNRKYKVKRAIDRDDLKIEMNFNPDEMDLLEAERYYNAFAASKGLDYFSISRYKAAMDKGCLVLASVKNSAEDVIALNGYLLDYDNMISTFAFGASHFRFNKEQSALIGRANSYLHYYVMCQLKSKGFLGYDFGGLYIGSDEVLNNISDFKKSFGGEIIEYAPKFIFQKKDLYTCEQNLLALNDIIKEKNIIIWGYSVWGKYIIDRLNEVYNIKPICIIDNGIKNDGVMGSDALAQYSPATSFLIITTRMVNYKRIIEESCVKAYLENKSILCIREEYL